MFIHFIFQLVYQRDFSDTSQGLDVMLVVLHMYMTLMHDNNSHGLIPSDSIATIHIKLVFSK